MIYGLGPGHRSVCSIGSCIRMSNLKQNGQNFLLTLISLVQSENSDDQTPIFRPMCCSSCFAVIRGTHFRCLNRCVSTPSNKNENTDDKPYILCETCARNNVHPHSHLRKFQKHCVVANSVSQLQSQQICQCHKLPYSLLVESSLFPFCYMQRGIHRPECGLLNVMPEHIEARYANVCRGKKWWGSIMTGGFGKALVSTPSASCAGPLKMETLPENKSFLGSIQTDGHDQVPRSLAKKIVKPIIRQMVEKIPFGNVHMALMFGPLVIENGVPE
jgi:hypothetical protein